MYESFMITAICFAIATNDGKKRLDVTATCKGAKMELVKIAIAVTSGLIPVLCVANYFLARANRII